MDPRRRSRLTDTSCGRVELSEPLIDPSTSRSTVESWETDLESVESRQSLPRDCLPSSNPIRQPAHVVTYGWGNVHPGSVLGSGAQFITLTAASPIRLVSSWVRPSHSEM